MNYALLSVQILCLFSVCETSRRRGFGRVPSPTSTVWRKHLLLTVYARDDAARADIKSAVHRADFRKI